MTRQRTDAEVEAAAIRLARDTAADQGLPEFIEDEVAIAKIVNLMTPTVRATEAVS